MLAIVEVTDNASFLQQWSLWKHSYLTDATQHRIAKKTNKLVLFVAIQCITLKTWKFNESVAIKRNTDNFQLKEKLLHWQHSSSSL